MDVAIIAAEARANYARLAPWNFAKVREYLREKEGIAQDQLGPMEMEYKRFLAITLAMPAGENFPISAEIDPFWHTHLLFTHDYTSMCHEVAGGIYVHHIPAVTDEERGRLCSAYRDNTLPIYREAFGEADPRFWPADAQICVACCDRPSPEAGAKIRQLII